jgi:dihydrofolate synthase/folylpolyglutamate synthase
MNYQDTVNWLFKQLPMYQTKGQSAYKKDLSNIFLLAKHLHNPETKFKSIHVAGTNGKGSTSHMLASILQEAGYKVGLYTSPHLKDYRERIRLNGEVIGKKFVIGFVKRNRPFFEINSLSFFEMTVGLAFDYFAKQKVDIAVIEVGLGGRLDSTNIISPELSVITNIGFDHVALLGHTRELIAAEKAGIIKSNIPVVIGETHSETATVFKTKAVSHRAEIYFADQLIADALESDLKGFYQVHNIKTVIQSVEVLKLKGYKISNDAIKSGLLNVVKNTVLLGRWQMLQETPKIVCDTAHNEEGLRYAMQQLKSEDYNKLHIVFGVVNDKDLFGIIALLPKEASYYLCKPNIERGLEVLELAKYFELKHFNYTVYGSVNEAFDKAKSLAFTDDFIYVGGSTFVVAEIL